MNVRIRKFEKRDIPNKVKWINDPENNTFLHDGLPLEIGKTEAWFEKNQDRTDRYDAVIEADGSILHCAPHEELLRISPTYLDIVESQSRQGGAAV